MGAKKNFVLDTNVILHDYKCIYNFEENDIYIPIVVLEEVDKFKKGNDQINFNAREFIRELDSITDDYIRSFLFHKHLASFKHMLIDILNPQCRIYLFL